MHNHFYFVSCYNLNPSYYRTTKTGGLPGLSFVKYKLKLLDTEFKFFVDSVLNVMCWLEVHESKDRMKKKPFFKQLGATASCVLCVVTAGKYIKTYHDYPPLTQKDEESDDEESIGQSSEDHIIIDKIETMMMSMMILPS